MDRDKKIARLEKWLEEYDALSHTFGGKTSGITGEIPSVDTKLYRTFREAEAVRHELHRQTDKKIIEDLGIFAE